MPASPIKFRFPAIDVLVSRLLFVCVCVGPLNRNVFYISGNIHFGFFFLLSLSHSFTLSHSFSVVECICWSCIWILECALTSAKTNTAGDWLITFYFGNSINPYVFQLCKCINSFAFGFFAVFCKLVFRYCRCYYYYYYIIIIVVIVVVVVVAVDDGPPYAVK